MEYMTQLNRFFEKAEIDELPTSAQIVYLHLLNINNKLYWREWFKVANSRLENLTGLKSNNSVVSAKNRLKQAGLIDFKSDGKVVTRYKILPLTAQDGAQDTAQVSAQDTAHDTAQDGAQDTAQRGAQLKRQKTKTKNIYTPIFEKVWNVYPRKDGKLEAQKAFEKLSPSDELLEVMLSAIERQKQSEKWQSENGKFIPYFGTWLNQHRWEDKGVIFQVTPSLSPEEEAKRVEENNRRYEAAMKARREKLGFGGITSDNESSERSAS